MKTIADVTARFSDVSEATVHAEAIADLSARGVVGGYPDGTFQPDREVNRVEALKIILLGSGISVDQSLTTSFFADTFQDAWYISFVARARALGIIQGYPDGTFRPGATLNLVEGLKILIEANRIDVSGIGVEANAYADVSVDAWFATYVQYAKMKGLIDADSNNKVYPNQPMDRSRLAEVMYRLSFLQRHDLEAYPLSLQERERVSGQLESSETMNDGTTDSDVEVEMEAEVEAGAEVDANMTVLSMEASDFFFSPTSLRIAAGTPYRIHFTTQGNHTFTIDELGIDMALTADDTFDLTVDQPGTYTFYCSFHQSMGMEGTLIVE
ncbi:MAG: S-layer homology domain-containing protein [Candidatus Gracilibacteria bacterium]|nr:S-layer homology domain-containing protein [Candidatus Gracilibacteria bacterium]